jgi:hypothetical protein
MSTDSFINPWQYKPWWCQPWSILLTGVTLMLGSWVVWKNIWLTLVIVVPVAVWIVYFIVIWPILMQPYLAANCPSDRQQDKI